MQKPTLLFAGGGTGGHVMPILALLQYIDQSQYKTAFQHIYRAGSQQGLEYTLFPQQSYQNIQPQFIQTFSGKFRRETRILSILKNIRDIFIFIGAIFYNIYLLRRYHVDIVFCKGGFIALPVVVAAALYRKRIFVHESDVKPGLTNKIASWFATKTFTGFDHVLPHSIIVGQILSEDIITHMHHAPLDTIHPTKTNILVMGGSQGSGRVNETIKKVILANPQVADHFHFHVIGGYANQQVSQLFKGISCVSTYGFIDQPTLASLYYACDIAITRAGTTSLAEQALYNMLLWIIPIPRTHDQYDNAARYQEHYGASLIDQKKPNFESTIDLLLQQHIGYCKKAPDLNKMRKSIHHTKDTILQHIF